MVKMTKFKRGLVLMIHIFTLPLTNISWTSTDERLLPFVSLERKEKILRYRFSVDRKLSLYAALLTRMELSKLIQIPAKELTFQSSTSLKPKLLSSQQCFFNFSHTHNFILCAISNSAPLGVDTELICNAPLDLMDIAFHSVEKQYITSTPALINQRFFKIWTQKEAYTKYLEVGLTAPIQNINMLDPIFASHMISFIKGNYFCSIYSCMMLLEAKTTYFLSFFVSWFNTFRYCDF